MSSGISPKFSQRGWIDVTKVAGSWPFFGAYHCGCSGSGYFHFGNETLGRRYRGQECNGPRRIAGLAGGANDVDDGENGCRRKSPRCSPGSRTWPWIAQRDGCSAADRGGSAAVCDGTEAPWQNEVRVAIQRADGDS